MADAYTPLDLPALRRLAALGKGPFRLTRDLRNGWDMLQCAGQDADFALALVEQWGALDAALTQAYQALQGCVDEMDIYPELRKRVDKARAALRALGMEPKGE